ncbi:stage II sporulation protein E [Leptospira levettii]|uniref:7TM diverse intracellular signaling domain-containing protein n=2 Tax=Leptospira levettii TaxID=2023178 RepID=UPI000C29A7E4|nr:7TM diverse intracellular signaling domain-containing protein [Leptospira levettii]MCW7472270.1 SpoIIE family protein phosphatase [Leptospira levettii]PJZ37060.1 stage II sporulation protein E [Leptospira levettii]PJZ88205.1 stage II sporulation protein E [Leptospira levettii]
MIKKLLIVLVFSFSQLESSPLLDFTIQNHPHSITSLDSNQNDPSSLWYMKENGLEESEIQNLTEENFSKYDWKRIKVPGNLTPPKENEKQKRTVILAKWIEMDVDPNIQYSFRLGIINDRDRTYLNGKLIGKTGEWDSPFPQNYDKLRIYSIPSHLILPKKKNLLLIKIQLYFQNSGGIEQDETLLGPSTNIQNRFYKDEFIKLIFLTIYITVGSYFLFLFIRRRKDRENLFFSLFSFSFVLYNFLRNQLKYELGFSFLEMKKLEYLTILLLIPFMYHFLRTLFEDKYVIFAKILDGFQLLVFSFFLFSNNIEHFNFVLSNLVQPTWILYVILIFSNLIRNLRKKEKRAIYITIGLTIVLIAAIIDTATNRNYWVFPRIMGYAFLFFNISLAMILANSFVKLNEEFEDLNKNLEKKVEDRTDALNESLNQLQILKEKQDGDYFLTSLLIQPLARIENKIPELKIESYTNQKKKFQFRGKNGEIGGDICIVGSIHLESGEYTVFANADAMGKSIQGAGGALVLGVVFQAVLSRAKSSYTKRRPPELWLKDLYVELQSVFASFDGSMLSSVVLGMVGKNGYIYYINAEHPWSILYRDGVASFIETELSMRKLGFPRNNSHFQIKTFSLLDGDVLLVGSDGRDDIGLMSETENRYINEDETLILRFVERTDAKLLPLVQEIENNGEITDDISFLRIAYQSEIPKLSISEEIRRTFLNIQTDAKKGNYENALSELIPLLSQFSHPNFHSFAGKIYFHQKKWIEALNHLKLAFNENQSKENLLYMIAKSEFQLGKIEDAVIWCERLFLRNKSHKQNTKLFFRLLDLTENFDKKSFYLEFLSHEGNTI